MLSPRQLQAVAKANGEKPIECLVPGCTRKSWRFRHAAEYICGTHMKLADRPWVLYRNRIGRAADKAELQGFDVTVSRQKQADIWSRRIVPQVLSRALGEPEEAIDDIEVPKVRAVTHEPDF